MTTSAVRGFEYFDSKFLSTVIQQNNNQNLFFSPIVVALAMSMCAVGARHETLSQILRVLDVPTVEQLTKTAEQIIPMFSMSKQDKPIQLKLINRLYAHNAYKLQQEYLTLARNYFKAGIQLEDFVANGTNVINKINKWIEDQTNRLIKHVLSESDITADTRFITVSGVYFKGTWIRQFEEDLTNHDADFHGADGTISKISLMHRKEKYLYAENNELFVQIAHIPYKSDNQNIHFVFTVVLPIRSVSLEDVEQKLAEKPGLLQKILSYQNTRTQQLLLHLPKFKMEGDLRLNDVLMHLGIIDAFDNIKADFAGINNPQSDETRLFLNQVIHKAIIDVNEQGGQVVASTSSNVCVVAPRPHYDEPAAIEFKVDRPFLFFIRESRQNILLFCGKFAGPPAPPPSEP